MKMGKLKQRVAWALISTMMLSNTGQAFAAAGWNQDSKGWTYEAEAGNKVAGEWVLDGTVWYHLNKDGYMETGWFQDTDGRWYYLNPNTGGPLGAMMTGWIQDATGKWYYMNPNTGGPKGSMMTGWIVEGQKRWFLNADGSWNGQDGIAVSTGGGSGSGGSGGSSGGGGKEPAPDADKMQIKVGDKDNTYGWSYDKTLKTYTVAPGEYTGITVTAEVGNDTVMIENVSAEALVAQGGGSNSIILRNTQISGVYMDKDSSAADSQSPRLLLEGKSAVKEVVVTKPAILESNSKEVSIAGVVATGALIVQGSTTSLDKVAVYGAGASVHISESTIKEVTLSNGAEAAASSGGSVDNLLVSSSVTLNNLPINTSLITEGSSEITMSGSTSVPVVEASYPTTLTSKGDSAQVSVVNTSASLTVENTTVDLIVTTGDNASIKADKKASLNAVVVESGKLSIESSSEDINIGKIVANDGVTGLSVGASVTVSEVETRGNIEIDGDGTVNAVAAASGTTVTGTVGEAAAQITVSFLDDFTPIRKSVSYGGTLPVLETTYPVGDNQAQINWPEYAFTSKKPGTYTVAGVWTKLPDGIRAGDVTPVAVITVEAPDEVNLTFAESNGLTGFDITLTSSDGGEILSKESTAVTVIKGKTYTYTISKSGYEAVSGTVKAEASQSISITLAAAATYYSLRFETAEWSEYTDSKLPENGNYLSGTKLVLPKAHNRAGYDLVWTDDAGNVVNEAVASKNTTYTAAWKVIEYPVKYVGAETEGAKETYTVDDNTYTLPQPADTDAQVFCGWYTAASFSGQPVTTIAKGSTGAKTYYARWITDMEAAGLLENNVPVTGAVSPKDQKLDKVLFAKGGSVAVNSYNKDKILVTFNGVQYLAPAGLNIYAGGYNTDSETAASKITVNDGTVGTIFGGGAGDIVFSTGSTANVTGDVAITVKDGTVNRIYGGGTGRSEVKGTVTIEVQKADNVISIIYGGGAAPSGTMDNPEGSKSENHVEHVEIIVAEGVTVDKLIGGGVGIASVNSNKILLNGTVEKSMIAGGNNGYTGEIDVTLGGAAHLKAGNAFPDDPQYEGMTIYQAGFRGTIGDVRLFAESGARIDGDMFIGINSLYKNGQDADITGSLTAVFEDGFQCDGDIYLGVGSNGDSLDNIGSIAISGPVEISPMMYSQAFTGGTTLDMVSESIKEKVTLDNGAVWASGFAGGTGTEEDPYVIATENQFKLMYSNTDYAEGGYSYRLDTDIDLKQADGTCNKNWSFGNYFSGTLDGGGHTISYSGTDTRVLFDTAGDAAFTNLNVHMKGEGLLGLTFGFTNGSLIFEKVDVDGDKPVIVGNNESAYVMVGYHNGGQRLESLRFTDCSSRLDYKTTLQNGYAAAFIGGYVYNAAAGTITEITFERCANYGSITGVNPAVFMGNPTYPDRIELTMRDTYNYGTVTGTKTAGLFSRFNNSTGLDKWNEEFESCNKGIISISRVDGLKLGLSSASQEYLIKDTSNGKYDSYVLTLSAYAREVVDADMKAGSCVIGNSWTFTSAELASASDWGATGIHAGKFVTGNNFISGDNTELEAVDSGSMIVNGEEFAYTLYYDGEESCFYYVFDEDTISLYGCEYEFNNVKASAFLYGVDADGNIYGPMDSVETINDRASTKMLASPSNAVSLTVDPESDDEGSADNPVTETPVAADDGKDQKEEETEKPEDGTGGEKAAAPDTVKGMKPEDDADDEPSAGEPADEEPV